MTISTIWTMVADAPPMAAAAAGLTVLGLVQVTLLWRVARSTRAAADATARVAQLTSALELLTDTTEEGFVNVGAELGRLGAKPLAPAASRRATTKRIAAAAKRGRSVEEIAIAESLSESEVRLHVGLDAASIEVASAEALPPEAMPTEPGPEAERAPGVLDDLERWMHSLQRPRRARGSRHATVRV